MTTVVSEGLVKVGADVSGVEAGMAKAKRSIRSLGESTKNEANRSSKSIDNYIQKLRTQNATFGKSSREIELYKLQVKGATAEQIKSADSLLRIGEAQKKQASNVAAVRGAMVAGAALLTAGTIAAAVAFDRLIEKAASFQDMAEKVGDTGENIASLAVAAAEGGTSMDALVAASVRLTKSLTGVDDESKAAGAALKALNIPIEEFKRLKPADQLETLGKALSKFADGPEKTAAAVALLGRAGAEMLPTLKILGEEGGRQVILTQKQIDAADAYKDAQARLGAQISLTATSIATDALPIVTEFTSAIAAMAKDQDFAATASELLQGSLKAGIVIFQTIAVVASDVGFVFKGVGREIGGMLAQLDALARWDFDGFTAIGDAMKADADRARKELDKFQAQVMAIGQPVENPASYSNEGRGRRTTRPRLPFDGAVKGGEKSKANQEAKSQLALELETIKTESEKVVTIYTNSEKILEARRSANLVDERTYFEAKTSFIRLYAEEQERAVTKEIALLSNQKLTGKEKIDNDRKILEAEGKLIKIRQTATAEQEVNSIQSVAAMKKVTDSYIEATAAADAYLDTVRKQNERELAGIGRGNKFRERQAGFNEIEDNFTNERRSLERDLRREAITKEQFDRYLAIAKDTYAKEVDLYEQRTAAVEARQQDWATGMSEAFANYIDEARDVASQTEDLFTRAFGSAEEALVEFMETGKLDFRKFAKELSGQLNQMFAKSIIADAAAGIRGGALGDGIADLFKRATGPAGGVAGAAGAAGEAAASTAKVAAITAETTALTASTAATTSNTASITAATAAVTSDTAAITAKTAAESAATTAIATASASSTAALTALAAAAQAAAAALASIQASAAMNSGGQGMSSIVSLFGASGPSGGTFVNEAGWLEVAGSLGFSKGGYTGDKPPTEAAGVVHGKEYVFSAPAVKTIGIEALESIHEEAKGGKATLNQFLLAEREAGKVSGSDMVKSVIVSGARDLGGHVSAGTLVRVNEREPELLTVAGNQYLMMGTQGGDVQRAEPKGGDTIIQVNVTPPKGSSRETAMQWGASAGRQLSHATRRNS